MQNKNILNQSTENEIKEWSTYGKIELFHMWKK